jgi:hypothetical protein
MQNKKPQGEGIKKGFVAKYVWERYLRGMDVTAIAEILQIGERSCYYHISHFRAYYEIPRNVMQKDVAEYIKDFE